MTVEYQKAILDNGVTLVMERHPQVRSVCVGAWVKVGSGSETPDLNGVSHFIEHMVFKGTTSRTPLQLATVLEALGGDLNAFTDRECTCFHATVLSEHVEIAMDVLSDLILHPKFDKVQLERERKVLLQELFMIEETPDDWINDLFFESVWKGHPLGQPIIGTKKTIQGLTRAQLIDFFTQYYRPDNMVISVAGNIEFENLKQLCEKYFDPPPAQKLLLLRPPPARYRAKRKLVVSNTDQTHLLLGYEGVGFRSPYRFEALLLSFYLGGGMSSRLFQEIREKAALAYTVDCDFVPFVDSGVFTVYAAVAPRSIRRCLDILSRELGRVKEKLLTEADLNLIKGQLKGTILLCADQMETRQESLGRNELVFGRYVSVEEVIDEINQVTVEEIRELARRVFVGERETIVTVGPSKPRLPRSSIL